MMPKQGALMDGCKANNIPRELEWAIATHMKALHDLSQRLRKTNCQ